jgi:hypothetical protein
LICCFLLGEGIWRAVRVLLETRRRVPAGVPRTNLGLAPTGMV